MPEKVTFVYEIGKDDPRGIETYWPRRFAERRQNGEGFVPDRSDITAFRSRKSMAKAVGVSRQELYYLRRSGNLLQVAYGIQRLTRVPASPHEDMVVTCLWAGEGVVASHESALVVFGIGEAMPPTVQGCTAPIWRSNVAASPDTRCATSEWPGRMPTGRRSDR